jgi:UDP-GlcNAc3NAcA epimerase
MERFGLLGLASGRLILAEPLGYLDTTRLETTAAVVATDSGGVQKEAYFHRTPCVTLRTETEWVELIELGWNVVQPPTDPRAVAGAVLSAVGRKGRSAEPYGSGDAARRIAETLLARTMSPALK